MVSLNRLVILINLGGSLKPKENARSDFYTIELEKNQSGRILF